MWLFPEWQTAIAGAINKQLDALVTNYGDAFEHFSAMLLSSLVALETAMRAAPPLSVIAIFTAFAGLASRRWMLTLFTAAGLWFIGAIGLWDQAMQTLALISVSVVLAIVIGLPLGIFAALSRIAHKIMMPLLDLAQTIPSFVYLIPAAMLFGLGKVPAILATVIYATPPLIRLTALGIQEVNVATREASRAFGATRWQILKDVELPLALPTIMQGINQTILLSLSMVVIASMIGARGIGEVVLLGLQRSDPGMGFIGGLGIVVIAIIIDRVTQAYGRRLQSHRIESN